MTAPDQVKPVVLIAEELSPATVEALGPDFEVRHCNGADRAELLPAIVDVDAILVRSATKVDAEALAAARELLEEVRRAVTHAGELLVQRVAVHPAFRLRLNSPGDPSELLGKRHHSLLNRLGRRDT